MSESLTLSLNKELTVLGNIINPNPALKDTFHYFTREIGERFAPHMKNSSVQDVLLTAIKALRKKDAVTDPAKAFTRNAKEAASSLLKAAEEQGGLGNFGDALYEQGITFTVEDGGDAFSWFEFPKIGSVARLAAYKKALGAYVKENPEQCAEYANENLTNFYAFRNEEERGQAHMSNMRMFAEVTLARCVDVLFAADPQKAIIFVNSLKNKANGKIFQNDRDNSIRQSLGAKPHSYEDLYEKSATYKIHKAYAQNLEKLIQVKLYELAETDSEAALKVGLVIEAIDLSDKNYEKLPILIDGALNPVISEFDAEKLRGQISWRGLDTYKQAAPLADKTQAAEILRAIAKFYHDKDPKAEAQALNTTRALTALDGDAIAFLDRYREIYVGDPKNWNDEREEYFKEPMWRALNVALETTNPDVEAKALALHEDLVKTGVQINGYRALDYTEETIKNYVTNERNAFKGNPEKQNRCGASLIKSWMQAVNKQAHYNAEYVIGRVEKLGVTCSEMIKIAPTVIGIIRPLVAQQKAAAANEQTRRATDAKTSFEERAAQIPETTPQEFISHFENWEPEPEPQLIPQAA